MVNDPVEQQLEQAYQFLKQDQPDQAREILMPLSSRNRENVDCWWLLANSQTNVNAVRDALKIVLKLNPNHEPAQALLKQISNPSTLNQAFSPPFSLERFSDVPYLLENSNFSANLYDNLPANMPGSLRNFQADPPPRRSNGCVRLLLIFSALAVVACIGCAGLGVVAFSRMSSDPTFQAMLGTVGAMVSLPEQLPSKTQDKGFLKVGVSVNGTIGQGIPQTYQYEGSSGETITINLASGSSTKKSTLTIMMGLYGSDGKRVAGSGLLDMFTTAVPKSQQGANNLFPSQIVYTIPKSGKVTLLLQSLSPTESYVLQLDSQPKP